MTSPAFDPKSFKKKIFEQTYEINPCEACWNQLNVAPHYVPEFLLKIDKEEALQLALEEYKSCKYPNECRINAHNDYNSIITKENIDLPKEVKPNTPPPSPGPTFEDVAKRDPFIFWPFFLGWSIIFAIILVIFIRTLISKNKK